MPIPILAFNLVASLRAAPASTSRPVHQVRVQQKSTRRPRANSRGANGVCFDAATRRTDHAWAYRGSAWLDRTSPRVTRGLPPVSRRVHHRPSALTRARPFVTLGRSPAERGTDLKYRGDDGRPFGRRRRRLASHGPSSIDPGATHSARTELTSRSRPIPPPINRRAAPGR